MARWDPSYDRELYPPGKPCDARYRRYYASLPGARLRCVPACSIRPPHGVVSETTLEMLLGELRRVGWVGRPLLVEPNPRVWERRSLPWHGLTGSHRRAAACRLRLTVPVLVLNRSAQAVLHRGETLDYFVDEAPRRGYGRLAHLADLGGRRRG